VGIVNSEADVLEQADGAFAEALTEALDKLSFAD